MMPGYYKRPDLTRQVIVDGWLHSGDLGYVDEDGYLYLVDRKKDMIISGGVNVYPRDIEEVVVQHPGVREVAVFGVPDAKWGETPIAAVALRSPGAATAEELDGVGQRAGGCEVPAGQRRLDRRRLPPQRGGQDAQARAAAAIQRTMPGLMRAWHGARRAWTSRPGRERLGSLGGTYTFTRPVGPCTM